MSVELKDDTFIALIVTAILPPDAKRPGDYFGILTRAGDGQWRFDYRFRYYTDPDKEKGVFDSDDERSWYRMTFNTAPAMEMVEEKISAVLALTGMRDVTVTPVRDFMGQKFIDIIAAHPMMHMRLEEKP